MPHIEVKPCRAAHSPRHTGEARAAGGLSGPMLPPLEHIRSMLGSPLSLSLEVLSRVVYNIRPKAIGSLGA